MDQPEDEFVERSSSRPEDAIDPPDAPRADAEASLVEDQRQGTATETPLLPALASRIESANSTLLTLATRIDGLAAATTGLRSMLADRLAEYADAMAQVGRSQADTIEEYRHGSDRALAEVRHSIAGNEEFFRKLSGRVDELLSDSQAVSEIVRATTPESPSRDNKRLSRQIAKGFDGLGGQVDALGQEVISSTEAIGEQLLALLNELPTELNASNAAVHDALRWLQHDGSELPAGSDPGMAAASNEVTATIRAMSEQLVGIEAAVSAPHYGAQLEIADELRLLRDEVQQLKRRIGVRARAPVNLEDDQLRTIADSVQAKLGANALDGREFDRIVDAIVKRLESILEVVPSDTPSTPPPKRAPARSSGEKRRPRGTQ